MQGMRNTPYVIVASAILVTALTGVPGAQQPAQNAPTFSRDVAPIIVLVKPRRCRF
jgi:hypothetical protein